MAGEILIFARLWRSTLAGGGVVPRAIRRSACFNRATIGNFTRSVWDRLRQGRRLDGQWEVERNNSCRDAAMSIAKLLATLARAVAALRSAPVGPANSQWLSCTARAHVPKPKRRAACLHVSRAMQAA
jgi:hypothetical protein